jgi:hypothetical protein
LITGSTPARCRRQGYAGVYGALLLAAYDADADVFRTVTKCGADVDQTHQRRGSVAPLETGQIGTSRARHSTARDQTY